MTVIGNAPLKAGTTFPASGDYLRRTGGLAGGSTVLDSRYILFSFLYRTSATGIVQVLNNRARSSSTVVVGSAVITLAFDSTQLLKVSVTDGSKSRAYVAALTASVAQGRWHHICGQIDFASRAMVAYHDGVAMACSNSGSSTAAKIAWYASTAFDICDINNVTTGKADLADEFIWFSDTPFDLTKPGNRAKFLRGRLPAPLGADGSRPTGAQPQICLSGAPAAFVVNRGSGGNFTPAGNPGSAFPVIVDQ